MGPGAGGWPGRAGRASRHTGPPPPSLWKQRPPCRGRKDLWEGGSYRAAGVTQMRGREEARAVGSAYLLWCRSPGADGAAPPRGEKEDRDQGSAISRWPSAGSSPRGPQGRRVSGGAQEAPLLELSPTSQPSPPILSRYRCSRLARRLCTEGTGFINVPGGPLNSHQDV